MEGVAEILRFWFLDSTQTDAPLQAHMRRWFHRSTSFDRCVRQSHGNDIDRALHGQLDHWAGTSHGRLALILLLDQMTRNAFRGTIHAYAGDTRAICSVSRALISEPIAASCRSNACSSICRCFIPNVRRTSGARSRASKTWPARHPLPNAAISLSGPPTRVSKPCSCSASGGSPAGTAQWGVDQLLGNGGSCWGRPCGRSLQAFGWKPGSFVFGASCASRHLGHGQPDPGAVGAVPRHASSAGATLGMPDMSDAGTVSISSLTLNMPSSVYL